MSERATETDENLTEVDLDHISAGLLCQFGEGYADSMMRKLRRRLRQPQTAVCNTGPDDVVVHAGDDASPDTLRNAARVLIQEAENRE